MGLLSPAALFLFALIPALVLAYLVRERPVRATVSSILAFRALRALRAQRPWGRPRFNWMFLVELIILTLAVIAIAGPYLMRDRRPLAVVLDNSAVMQARIASGGTRWDAARSQLATALESEATGDEITVYVTAPVPHPIGAPLRSIAAARSAIARIAVTDAPSDAVALKRLLDGLASGHRFAQVLFASATAVAPPAPDTIRPITVGAPLPNYAIGSFVLRRDALGKESIHARLTIANFSSAAQTLTVAISGDGKPLGQASAHLAARESGELEFPALPPANVYEARLMPADGFPLDNVAMATAGAVKPVSVLFITPTPADAGGLGALAGVNVRVLSPESYSPDDLASADVAIFEYASPKELPAVNALLVMPPPAEGQFNFAIAPSNQMNITGWRTPNPLTDGVNFRLLELRRGEYFATHSWMDAIVSGSGGGLILAGDRQGHRYIATGFNPFPYLGRKNLPMSVLTLNLLSSLAGLGIEARNFRTGEPWATPAGVQKIKLPSGREVAATPGHLFTDTAEQGNYELFGPGSDRTLRAINLGDLAESDLDATRSIKIEAPSGGGAPAAIFKRIAPLAPYLLAAALAMAAAEAIFAYRRRRPILQAGP